MAISVLSTNTSSNMLKIKGRSVMNVTRPRRGQPKGHGATNFPVGLFIVVGCDRIKAEQDGNNNMNELDVPLVVPHELVKVASQHFISDVLNFYRPCLDHFWSKEETNEIEVKQRDLIKQYNNNQHIE